MNECDGSCGGSCNPHELRALLSVDRSPPPRSAGASSVHASGPRPIADSVGDGRGVQLSCVTALRCLASGPGKLGSRTWLCAAYSAASSAIVALCSSRIPPSRKKASRRRCSSAGRSHSQCLRLAALQLRQRAFFLAGGVRDEDTAKVALLAAAHVAHNQACERGPGWQPGARGTGSGLPAAARGGQRGRGSGRGVGRGVRPGVAAAGPGALRKRLDQRRSGKGSWRCLRSVR